MANSSFFKNTGTSTQIQGSASASAAAALASEQAALASENAAQTSETNSAASAAASLVSKNAAATSAASANSDALASAASAVTSQTAATSSSANAASTSADAVQTAADRVQTGLDRVATNSDAVQTAADRVQTGLDVTSSSASAAAALSSRNAAATSETNAAASAASSSADATATAADRVQTGLDRAATNADAIATAADRVQTGLDATASANSASAASTSATAAAASQVSAAASAASAAAVFNDFEDRYYGPHASDSAAQTHVTGLGLTVDQGDLYFNSTANEMRVFDGGSWIAASSAGGASLLNYNFTATASQTAFSGSDDNSNTLSYTVDNLIVTRNGVVLEDGTDYTATDGSTITLTVAAAAGDEINVVAFKSFTTADMVSATNGGTFQSNVTVNGTMTATAFSGDGSALTNLPAAGISDVVQDTTPQLGGNLDSNGNDVTFGDNDKAIFGAGSDLQVYHNGINSYVKDSGAGYLILGNSDAGTAIQDADNNNLLLTSADNISLGYNGGFKLATTATGVDVTGSVTADGLTVNGDATLDGTAVNFIFNETDTTDLNTRLRLSGALFSLATVNDSGGSPKAHIVVNNSSGDISFYEDTGTTPKFFWDASAESLGIGTSSPNARLTSASLSNTSAISVINTNATTTGLETNYLSFFGTNNGGSVFSTPLAQIGAVSQNGSLTQGSMVFHTTPFSGSSTERLRIDSSGRVTMPYQPMVSATRTINFGTLGGNTLLIPYNSATVNVGNHYNTSTGLFTCPVSGKYRVTAYGMNVSASGDGAFYYNALLVEVAGSTQQGTPYNYGDGYVHMSGSWIVSAIANDSIGIRTSSCLGGYGGMTIELIG